MTILTLPTTPAFKASRFGLMSNTQSFRSPLSGTVQTIERPGARWQAFYQLPPLNRAQAAPWQSFLTQLRGGAGRFYAYDPDARQARGSAAVSLTSGSNQLRNSVGAGAVVGIIGSGGAAPANWSFSSANGLTRQITALGSESGYDYIEVRFSGTPTSNFAFLNFETTTQIATFEGEVWSGSFFYKLSAGSTNNIIAVQQRFEQCQSNGTQTSAQYASVGTVDATWRRAVATRTITDTTPDSVRIRNGLFLSLTVGSAIDITLRIAQPQLERGSSATAYIPTTGSARSRGSGARVDGNASMGTTIPSWNWQPNVANVLRAGDYIAFETSTGRSLHLLTADASSDANGRAVLSIEPPLRTPPTDNTALITSSAACVMALVDESVRWESDAQGIVKIEFAAEERF
jgi:hypothetical protein